MILKIETLMNYLKLMLCKFSPILCIYFSLQKIVAHPQEIGQTIAIRFDHKCISVGGRHRRVTVRSN